MHPIEHIGNESLQARTWGAACAYELLRSFVQDWYVCNMTLQAHPMGAVWERHCPCVEVQGY